MRGVPANLTSKVPQVFIAAAGVALFHLQTDQFSEDEFPRVLPTPMNSSPYNFPRQLFLGGSADTTSVFAYITSLTCLAPLAIALPENGLKIPCVQWAVLSPLGHLGREQTRHAIGPNFRGLVNPAITYGRTEYFVLSRGARHI